MSERTYGRHRDSDSKNPPGRPRKANSLRITMRINKRLKEMIESEQIGHKHERDVDTLLRLLTERTDKIKDFHDRNDHLQKKLRSSTKSKKKKRKNGY